MKRRTKEEMTEYQRTRRKAIVTPDVTPKPIMIQPAVPDACPNCDERIESTGVIADLRARLATLEADQDAASNTTTPHSAAPNDSADTVALRQQVITAKVGWINNYGKNPCIGVASR